MMKIRSIFMLSTSLVLMSGVNSVIASAGADFGTKYTSTHHLGWSRQARCGLNCALKRVASNTVSASEFSRLSVTHLASPGMHLSPEFQNSPQACHPERSFSSIFDLDDNSFLAAGIMLEQRASEQHPSAANRWLTASVCFISDTENCQGISAPCSGAGCNPDPGNRCAQEGYIKKTCPAGQAATGTCPYDSGYVSGCSCSSGLVTCAKPYYGAGGQCGGKYERCEKDIPRACQEQNSSFTNTCASGWQIDPKNKCTYDSSYGKCCNKCESYYLSSAIPSGYVADTSKTCASCDGTKYAKKCDFGSEGSGKPYIKCGSLGGVSSGGTCADGSGTTYYKECKCPTNYEWASASKSCVCATSFKYSCSGTGYAGGTGASCNSKYKKCACASGYTWSDASGCIKCGSEFKFACTGANEVKPSTGGCGGLYTTCLCATGYTRYCSNPATDCSSLGYKSTSSCEGGLKCPWGNYWFCSEVEKTVACEVGMILNSDKTCSAEKVSGKTPIGVVFSSGKAVALKDISSSMDWSTGNSQCNSYSASGVTGWHLPTKEELLTIYDNISSVQDGLTKAGGTQFSSSYYWSSSAAINTTSGYRVVNPINGDAVWNYGGYWYVRPVLAF